MQAEIEELQKRIEELEKCMEEAGKDIDDLYESLSVFGNGIEIISRHLTAALTEIKEMECERLTDAY